MVSGDVVVRGFVVSEPVFLVPDGAVIDNGDLGADSGGAVGSADGGEDNGSGVLGRDKMGIYAEPRGVQCEGACAHHHICQLRRRHRLRHSRCDSCQGLLRPAYQFLRFLDCCYHYTGNISKLTLS